MNVTVGVTAYPVPSNAADTNWSAQQLTFLQALATAVNAASGALWGAWTPISYAANWSTNLKALAYRTNTQGDVQLRGNVVYGLTNVASTLATLASAVRPKYTNTFLIPSGFGTGAGGYCIFSIPATGVMTVTPILASGADVTAGIALDGLSFSTLT